MTDLPRDPKQHDIDLGLARLGEGLGRLFEPGAERSPCPETDHLDRACVYGEGHDLSVFPHRFEAVADPAQVAHRKAGEPWPVGWFPALDDPVELPGRVDVELRPPELYDQDARVFAEGVFFGQTVVLDVAADSVEGQAISKGALDGLALVDDDDPFPDPHAGLGLQGAARLLAEAVATGAAEVRAAGSDGSGRTVWRVTGLGPNIVHFGQAHVREALEQRWLVVGNGGALQVPSFVVTEELTPSKLAAARDADRRRTTAEARRREATEQSFRDNPDVSP